MLKQLSKQYLLCLKIRVQKTQQTIFTPSKKLCTNNSAPNIHYVSSKYTFNTNRGMSTLHLLPT
jgi:hypothetical protein